VARNIGLLSKTDWPADAFELTEWGPRIVNWSAGRREHERLQAVLLREIFGNPFRPITLDPIWLNERTGGSARSIYEDRAFDRMPLLDNALEEASCVHEAVLAHCRSETSHERGCWVLDLVLGRS
jgi:hypothetical protein